MNTRERVNVNASDAAGSVFADECCEDAEDDKSQTRTCRTMPRDILNV